MDEGLKKLVDLEREYQRLANELDRLYADEGDITSFRMARVLAEMNRLEKQIDELRAERKMAETGRPRGATA